MKKKVVIGFLGTKLDSGVSDHRWDCWRPTVALAGQSDFSVDRIELLLTSTAHQDMTELLAADIAAISSATQVTTHVLPDISDPWNFQQMYAALHDFARNFEFQDDCDYYMHLTTGTHVAQICLFLLTEARYFPGKLIETYSHNAHVAWKGSYEVIDLDLSSYDQLAQRFRQERATSQDLLKSGIATRNERFNELIGRIEKVALRSTAPILLMGPTGAGKSQLARRIYDLRLRRHLVKGEFVEVNCATLRGDNAMSALFGHKKGAFTGAATDRPGLLKSADGGILLLDEISTLGLDEQAMLLCALEDKRFKPMGSDKDVSSDFQLLVGTNEDLRQAVAEGTFRADLLARLNTWAFTLPGLAQRPEDIEPNLEHELLQAAKTLGTRVSVSSQARTRYLAFAAKHSWPGNFRDLSASVMRMATLAEGGRISEEEVRTECEQLSSMQTVSPSLGERANQQLSALVLGSGISIHDLFDVAQLDVVLDAIATTDNMAQAGRKLFGVSREAKENPNDSDRVRKFLARWSLDYADVRRTLLSNT